VGQARAHRRALTKVVGVLDEAEVFEMTVDLVGDAHRGVGGAVVDHDDLGALGPQDLQDGPKPLEGGAQTLRLVEGWNHQRLRG
jgi:hypothetical protein